MWWMSGGLSSFFPLCSQFPLSLPHPSSYSHPLLSILHGPNYETHVFIYFPETHSHQAVELNIWVYILEYEDIILQHSRANNGKANIGQPVHWQYLPLGMLCSGLSSWCLAGPTSLTPIRPHCFSWSWNTWSIHLWLEQSTVLTLLCRQYFFVQFLAHFRQIPNAESKMAHQDVFAKQGIFFPWGILLLALELPARPTTCPHTHKVL